MKLLHEELRAYVDAFAAKDEGLTLTPDAWNNLRDAIERAAGQLFEYHETGQHLYCQTCGSCGEDGCCPPDICFNKRLDKAAALLRDARPLSDERNGLQWMLDVRAWLAAHDSAPDAAICPEATKEKE
jgi:hypothetical protein